MLGLLLLVALISVASLFFSLNESDDDSAEGATLLVEPSRIVATSTTAPPAATTTTVAIDDLVSRLADEESARIVAVEKSISSVVTIQVNSATGSGFGSGFFYDASGLILTAAHVVTDAEGMPFAEAIVGITRGSIIANKVTAEIVGVDTKRDIAVLRVDTELEFGVAALALDERVQLGQAVIAIGSPLGLQNTVTSGIVSQVNRTIVSSAVGGEVLGFNLIQTDAPINSGNSGGALINLKGEVVGINILIQTDPSGSASGNIGLGFAVPINQAFDVAGEIVRGTLVSDFAQLGITGRTPEIGRLGALVVDVVAGEAAFLAGVQTGDLIIQADETEVNTFTDLLSVVRLHNPGDTIELVVLRPTGTSETYEELNFVLTLGSRVP